MAASAVGSMTDREQVEYADVIAEVLMVVPQPGHQKTSARLDDVRLWLRGNGKSDWIAPASR